MNTCKQLASEILQISRRIYEDAANGRWDELPLLYHQRQILMEAYEKEERKGFRYDEEIRALLAESHQWILKEEELLKHKRKTVLEGLETCQKLRNGVQNYYQDQVKDQSYFFDKKS